MPETDLDTVIKMTYCEHHIHHGCCVLERDGTIFHCSECYYDYEKLAAFYFNHFGRVIELDSDDMSVKNDDWQLRYFNSNEDSK